MEATPDPTRRFSQRVENYVKYRPSYPVGVLELLVRECGLTTGSVVADLGSGTGLLTRLFLAHGNWVRGVEPNPEMRAAGERLLNPFPRFTSHPGTAEATGLPDASVDLVTGGQAFHWFDVTATQRECRRLLRPGGWVAWVWNQRQTAATPFLTDYERILREFSDDYRQVNHADTVTDTTLRTFFAGSWCSARFDNSQHFDLEGLLGRVLSSSYAPPAGHPNHIPFLAALRHCFDRHQRAGTVDFLYDTNVYYGQPADGK